MNTLLTAFTLAPVVRGFIAMLAAGAAFPLCGVMVLRLDLIPMRYMLMHGVILGGAVSLALSLPLFPVTAAVNLLLVFLLLVLSKDRNAGFGPGSAAAMVASMALASLIIHKSGVNANSTLSLLWGSPFALQNTDLAALAALAAVLVLYIVLNIRTLLAVFYNREVARSLGIHVEFHYTVMVTLIALVVALAMKLLGALLIDALLVLPVLTASRFLAVWRRGTGVTKLFAASSAAGIIIAAAGLPSAVLFDLPPSASVALAAGILYMIFCFWRKKMKKLLIAALSLACSASLLSAAGSRDAARSGKQTDSTGSGFIASTPWTAAFADLAGIDGVLSIAPADMQHPPEYEITVSDIQKVTGSTYLLYAGYERMMKTLGDAAGNVTLIKIQTDNSIATVESQAKLIAAYAHTEAECDKRTASYRRTVESGKARAASAGIPSKKVFVHVMQLPLARDLGIPVAGTFGPGPVTAAQLAQAKENGCDIIIDNVHNSVAAPLAEVCPGAKLVEWRNFPETTGRGALERTVQANIDALIK